MNKKLIELIIMIILVAVFGEGILFGLIAGTIVCILKLVANKFLEPSKQLESPFASIGIGSLAGLVVSLVSFIL